MKTYKNLFDKLIDHENIYNAIINASRSKRDRPDVKKVLKKINFYIYRLQDLITQKRLKFRKHTAVLINDGMPQSERLVKLNQIAIQQMLVLEGDNNRHLLKG